MVASGVKAADMFGTGLDRFVPHITLFHISPKGTDDITRKQPFSRPVRGAGKVFSCFIQILYFRNKNFVHLILMLNMHVSTRLNNLMVNL